MVKLYVGIDPSENSTGVCVEVFEDNKHIAEDFYIIKSTNKLTRKENAAAEKYAAFFHYETFEKLPVTTDDNHVNEIHKADNFISILNIIENVLNAYNADYVTVCQEGISYGSSIRTRSVFDLAGLNFLLRCRMIQYGADVIVGTPAEIKKFATGKGNANKELMTSYFCAIKPDFELPKIDDIADAYFMAQYAIECNK